MDVDGRSMHTCVEHGVNACEGHREYAARIATSSVRPSTTAVDPL